MLLELVLLATLLSWMCAWALVRAGSRPTPTPEADIMRRRLKFDDSPRRRTDTPQTIQAADPDEVRQIMRQLGRRDAAGRAMAELILATAGPRRPL